MEEQTLDSAIDLLLADEDGEWLLNELWEPNSPIRRLLMCHWESLFPSLGDLIGLQGAAVLGGLRPPFMVLVGRPSGKKSGEEAEEDSEKDADDEGFIPQDFWPLILHLFVRIAKDNPSVLKLILAADYDYEMLLRETKGTMALDLSAIEQELKPAEAASETQELAPQPSDSPVLRGAKKYLREFLEAAVDDEIGLIRLLTQGASMMLYVMYGFAAEMLPDYHRRIGIPADVYDEAFKSLLEKDYLEVYSHGWVCPNCDPAQSHTLSPDAEEDVNSGGPECLRCDEEMDWLVFARVADVLWDAMRYRDGLVALAVGWHLRKKGLQFESSVPLKDGECDIVVGNPPDVVLELKMLWKPESLKGASDFTRGVEQADRAGEQIGTARRLVVHNCVANKTADLNPTSSQVEIIPYLDLAIEASCRRR